MWSAVDGYCYWARKIGSFTIEFMKLHGGDTLGLGGSDEIVTRQYPLEMVNLGLLGVDDNMNLFLTIQTAQDLVLRVAVYDTLFQLQTEFILPSPDNRYDWGLGPFMRHDGNVYEFRCTDDGMHIHRWVRE